MVANSIYKIQLGEDFRRYEAPYLTPVKTHALRDNGRPFCGTPNAEKITEDVKKITCNTCARLIKPKDMR